MKKTSAVAFLVLCLMAMGSGWDSRIEVQGNYWVAQSFTVASGDTMVRFPLASLDQQALVDSTHKATWVKYLDFTADQICTVVVYTGDAASDSMSFLSAVATTGGGFTIPPLKSGVDSVRVGTTQSTDMTVQGWK